MQEQNLNQSAAARKIGTTRDNVNNWFHGEAFPCEPVLHQIAERLGISLGRISQKLGKRRKAKSQ